MPYISMITLRPSPFLRAFVHDAPFLNGHILSRSLPGVRVVRAELDRFVGRLKLQGLDHGPFHQTLTHFGYGATNGCGLNENQARRFAETFDGLPRKEQLGVMAAALAAAADIAEKSSDPLLRNQVLGIWNGDIGGLDVRFEGLKRIPKEEIRESLRSLRDREVQHDPAPLPWWRWPFALPAREWGQHLFEKSSPIQNEKKVRALLEASDFLGWGGAFYMAGEMALSAAKHALRLELSADLINEAFDKSGIHFLNSGHPVHAGYVFFSAGWYSLSLLPLIDAKGPKGEKLVSQELVASVARLALEKEETDPARTTSKGFVLALLQQVLGEHLWESGQDELAFFHFVDAAANAAKASAEATAFRILAQNVWSIVGVRE